MALSCGKMKRRHLTEKIKITLETIEFSLNNVVYLTHIDDSNMPTGKIGRHKMILT